MDPIAIALRHGSIDWQAALIVLACFTIVSISCFLGWCQTGTEKIKYTIEEIEDEQVLLQQQKEDENNHLQRCTICQEELLQAEAERQTRSNDLVKTKCCEYFFHRKCIRKWVRHQPSCPLCRAPFKLR